jgi:Ca2+-binding EF-hand superfamily protein
VEDEDASDDQGVEVEDFDNPADREFRDTVVRPYLEQIYQNLIMRESKTAKEDAANNNKKVQMTTSSNSVSKRIFQDYCRLPGLISHRFFEVACNSKRSKSINEREFVKVMSLAFMGELEQRIKLTYHIFDFTGSGWVTREDITSILNYLPPECIRETKKDAEVRNMIDYSDRVTQAKKVKVFLDSVY